MTSALDLFLQGTIYIVRLVQLCTKIIKHNIVWMKYNVFTISTTKYT